MTKFSVLVKIDRSGHGKAFLVCKATAWATRRSNVPAADVDVSAVEVQVAR